jgi:hypothetical protein
MAAKTATPISACARLSCQSARPETIEKKRFAIGPCVSDAAKMSSRIA